MAPQQYAPPSEQHKANETRDWLETGPTALGFNNASIRRAFVQKVFSIVMLQLSVSVGFIALFMFVVPATKVVLENSWLLWIPLIAVIVCLVALSCSEQLRRTWPTNIVALGVLTVSMSFLLGISATSYETISVILAVGVTAAVCLGLTLFAFVTKWDITSWAGYLAAATLVFILIGIAAIFVPSNEMLNLVYAGAGALLTSAYIVFDIHIMLGGHHQYAISPEEYILASLNLYLDIVRLFGYILKLVGKKK